MEHPFFSSGHAYMPRCVPLSALQGAIVYSPDELVLASDAVADMLARPIGGLRPVKSRSAGELTSAVTRRRWQSRRHLRLDPASARQRRCKPSRPVTLVVVLLLSLQMPRTSRCPLKTHRRRRRAAVAPRRRQRAV
jgi:hypothetical protein